MRSPLFALLTLFAAVFFVAVPAHAYNPHVIETPEQNEVLLLPHPSEAQTFFGELKGYPHMYEFRTKDPLRLAVEVLVPAMENMRTNVSGIVLRVHERGNVTEVARLRAREAGWETFFEPWGGDSYRRGSSMDAELEPGLYRIEFSTPDNIGKYAFTIGTEESSSLGYFARLGEIRKVKIFFGKSPWRVVESPFLYGPLVAVFLVVGSGALWWYARKRMRVEKTLSIPRAKRGI